MKKHDPEVIRVRGLGFFGALCIAFIVLKLVGVISWHWAWVLGPLWIPWALIFLIAIVCAIIGKIIE